MKYDMTDPCSTCPFLLEGGVTLTAERVREITFTLIQQQASFPCHKTTIEGEDEDGDADLVAGPNSQQCAGASIFLAHQGRSTQMERIAERCGMRVVQLNMDAPVVKSMAEMLRVHRAQRGSRRSLWRKS